MGRDEKIQKLKRALSNVRRAKGQAFHAWEIVKYTAQDDLSPTERRRRRREMTASKRLCLKAARLCARIELRILDAQME